MSRLRQYMASSTSQPLLYLDLGYQLERIFLFEAAGDIQGKLGHFRGGPNRSSSARAEPEFSVLVY